MLKELSKHINENIKYVALDFFDTCAHRDCNPEVVLYEWARRISLSLNMQVLPNTVYSIRKEVESGIKKTGIEEPMYKQLIAAIYTEIQKRTDISLDREQFIDSSYNIELNIEIKHIYLDSSIKELLDFIKKTNRKIVIVSDFYLDTNFLNTLLRKLQIFDYITEVYVSSDCGVRKSTGKLYSFVLKDLDITSNQLLMIGDNKHSDIHVPNKMGIIAIQKKNSVNHKVHSKKSIKKVVYEEAFGMHNTAPLNGFLPEIIFFIANLHYLLISKKVKDVFFCSREGQLMQILFDMYQDRLFGCRSINTHYFYISRKATFLPGIRSLDKENLAGVFGNGDTISVRDFLNSLQFDDDETVDILKKIHIDEDDLIDIDLTSAAFIRLVNDEKFVSIFKTKRDIQHQNLKDYLESLLCGTANPKEFHMVDIGWKGSIQDNLINLYGDELKFEGYYLGLLGKLIQNSEYKHGVLFSEIENEPKEVDLLSTNYMYYERVFAANHGSVFGFDKKDGKVIPLINDNRKEVELYNYIQPFQMKMKQSYEMLLGEYAGYLLLPVQTKAATLESCLRKQCLFLPKVWKMIRDARVKTWENFGSLKINGLRDVAKVNVGKNAKRKLLYVEYSYRLLDKLHLKYFYPFATLYCRVVYIVQIHKYHSILK